MSDEYPLSFEEIIKNPKSKKRIPSPITLLLDHPELPRNVAAITRLADAAGIREIYVLGGPLPSKKQKKSERISRNATEKITIQYLPTIDEVKQVFDKKRMIALEYTNKSQPFHTYQDPNPCALVIGNERSGISKQLLELCTYSLHIPMLGQNSSMNVAVATGIVVYHLLGNMGRI